MKEHRKHPLKDVQRCRAESERGSGLNGRKCSCCILLRDVQRPERAFRISRREKERGSKGQDHRGQEHRQDLDPAVADPVQDRILTAAVLFMMYFMMTCLPHSSKTPAMSVP